MGRILVPVIGMSLLAGAAAAAEPSGKADPNKLVCRTEGTVGSRLAKTRACHALAEWAELRRQTRENVQNIQGRRPAVISNDGASVF